MMLESAGIRMERCRYGGSALWSVRDGITGTAARRFAEKMNLFFKRTDGSLLLDLRDAGAVDSIGAEALARCREAHAGFRAVGRPSSWPDLPLDVRIVLRGLEPARDLETALAQAAGTAADSFAAELRRHVRIPVQIPVELFLGGRTAFVNLRDISRGGLGLDLVPADVLRDLAEAPEPPSFAILGLESDPLGREIAGSFLPGPVPVVPVHLLPEGGLGARFPESRPPV